MDVETIAPSQLWKLFILDSVQGVELGYDVRSARMRIWLLFRTTSSKAEARSSSGAIESRCRSSSACSIYCSSGSFVAIRTLWFYVEVCVDFFFARLDSPIRRQTQKLVELVVR